MRKPSTRTVSAAAVTLVAFVAAVLAVFAPVGAASAATTTWSPTGACGTVATTVVPANVFTMTVSVAGGAGGKGGGQSFGTTGSGGAGGTVLATIAVTPGATISGVIGCEGSNGAGEGSTAASAGWAAGGGTGHGQDTFFHQNGAGGGAGGGASAVCLGAACKAGSSTPLAIAGGGGGSGSSSCSGTTGGNGGQGGQGASTSAGGGAGPSGTTGGNGAVSGGTTTDTPGGAGGVNSTGGGGAGGASPDGSGGVYINVVGGGGGGGYAGGKAGSNASSGCVAGGAGGGGSSWAVSSATSVSYGVAATSAVLVTFTTASAPGAPTIGTATAGNASATLTWSAPASNGGSPVTGYVVTPYVGAAAQAAQTFNSTATTQSIVGLTNGTTYTFKVAAKTSVGTGAQSAASNAVTPATVPGAPTIGTATPGNASVALTWTAPASNGGSAVTGYVVTPYIGAVAQAAQTFNSTATAQSIVGLTNGTTYTFKVAAKNVIGTGAQSGASASATPAAPATAPGAPTIGTATAGNASATLTWTAPASNGGSAITGYVVTPYIGAVSQAVQTFASTATSQTLGGLTNGMTYTFKVAAKNAIGTGAQSASSNSVTPTAPAGVASAPTIGTATAGNASAGLTWTAPASNGGSAITGYVVTPFVGLVAQPAQTFNSTATSQTVIGLTNGTTYTFKVAAINGVGTGGPSAASNAVTPATVPGAPTIGTVLAGNASVDLTWTAPAANGGSAITGYVVTPYVSGVAQAARPFASTATSQTVTGLTNGTTYTFKVAATNGVGTGPQSAASSTVTPVVFAPFTSMDDFITQQFLDFADRAPTPAERAQWTAALTNGTETPAQLIDSLRTAPYWEPTLGPVIRLYSAYFLRLPDTSGLKFWLAKKRGGATLNTISSSFAGSSEFKTRYGNLGDADFVTLVYQNVLGRSPDAGGLAFWTGRLADGISRGTMMIGFSNSNEYATAQATTVAAVSLYYGMLRRVPTDAELAATKTRLGAGTPITTLIAEVLASPAYRARFT